MIKDSIVKTIMALFFVCLMAWNWVNSSAVEQLEPVRDYITNMHVISTEEAVDAENAMESGYTELIPEHDSLLDLNGSMNRLLNIRGAYSDMGMYVLDDSYIVRSNAYTNGEYEFEQVKSFYEFLQSNGIGFLYVNEPTKYTDDNIIRNAFGIETFSNRNMDAFLARLKETGIPYIDLRDNIREEDLDITQMFYKTDHHWTVPTGLWAARHIAEGLNEYCGYEIDTSLLENDRFTSKTWKEAWLGEQGRKLGKTYGSLDDYTELKPVYPTSFTFLPRKNKDPYEGTFDQFIDERIYGQTDVYNSKSWHYSYMPLNAINNNAEKGNLLMLDDSYGACVVPFVALGVHEIHSIIPRSKGGAFDFRKYILENDIDAVVMNYAQFMLGAHDDPENSNADMFSIMN